MAGVVRTRPCTLGRRLQLLSLGTDDYIVGGGDEGMIAGNSCSCLCSSFWRWYSMVDIWSRMMSMSSMNSSRMKKPTRLKKKKKKRKKEGARERERIGSGSEPGIRKHQLCQGQQWRRIYF